MTYRAYWFRVNFNGDIERFISQLKKKSFKEKDNAGFLINAISKNKVSGKFIHAKQIKQEFANPFGESTFEERTIFETIDFEFNGSKLQMLELQNPSRCTKMFFSELWQCADFGLSVDKFELVIPEFVCSLEKQGVKFNKIKELELVNLSYSSDLLGKLNLKGNVNLSNYPVSLGIENLKHKLSKIRAEVSFNGSHEIIEISSSGKFNMSPEFRLMIKSLIFEALSQVQ